MKDRAKRTREFDDGRLKIVFHTEQDAIDFDNWLNSETSLWMDGKEVARWKNSDNFNPYAHFGFQTYSTL